MTNVKFHKPNRYKNYDYSKSGGYFITICTDYMKQILSKIDVNHVVANSDCLKEVVANSVCLKDVVANSVCLKKDVAISNRQKIEGQSEIATTIVGDKIVYPNLQLTEIGNIIENVIIEISNHSNLIEIDSYVIMPNHIHLVIFLFDDVVANSVGQQEGQSEIDTTGRLEIATTEYKTRPSIPSIVRYLKSSVTKQCGKKIFQKLYYDEILRDEKHYQNVSSYVLHNPINWVKDKYYEKQ